MEYLHKMARSKTHPWGLFLGAVISGHTPAGSDSSASPLQHHHFSITCDCWYPGQITTQPTPGMGHSH